MYIYVDEYMRKRSELAYFSGSMSSWGAIYHEYIEQTKAHMTYANGFINQLHSEKNSIKIPCCGVECAN